jgi:peptidoglycan/LPS O-acetylase OafA/YrhL
MPDSRDIPLPGAAGSQPGRLHGLDTLRALAILVVMPYHLNDHFPEVLQPAAHFGWMGVDLFFVLSGYLIATQLFKPYLHGGRVQPGEFYRKRAFRILPAFFVVLALYVFVPLWREAPGLQAWWQFATFIENFTIDYGRNQAFSHAWSLCVEEHFYLLLPALTLVLMRRPAAWKAYSLLTIFVLLGVVLRAYVLLHTLRPMGPDHDGFSLTYIEKLYYPTYTRLDGLIAGVALALLRTFRPSWWSALARRGHSLAAAGLLAVVFAAWLSADRFRSVGPRAALGDIFGYPVLALGFALLTASALSENGLLARFRVPGARLIATLSFSLYLTHKEAVHLLLHVFPDLPDGAFSLLPVYFAACLAVAAALYLLVERPFLLLRDAKAGLPRKIPAPDLQARIDPAL